MAIRPATWGDLEAVAELLARQSLAVSGLPGVRVAQLRAEWGRPGLSLARDVLVAEDRGALAGFAALRPGGELVVAAEDEATADGLLAGAVARAVGRGDAALTVVCRSGEPVVEALVRRHPFALEGETLLMWRPLGGEVRPPEVPEGVDLRTYEDGDARAVHRLLDDAYTWDARHVPMAHEAWVRWMTGDPEFDPSVWWLAERGPALVGCALFWTSGWLKDLAVAAPERGRGVGAALVQQGLHEFAEVGMPRVGLKVDAANPTGAIRLYERAGFELSSRESVWRLTL